MKVFLLEQFCRSAFPLAVWFTNWPRITDVHRHDCIEMLFVTGGTGICIVNDLHYPMQRGDFYVMNRQDIHTLLPDEHFLYYNIMFKKELFTPEEFAILSNFPTFSAWMDEQNFGGKSCTFNSEDCEKVEFSCRRIAGELQLRSYGYELLAKSILIDLFIHILRMIESKTVGHGLGFQLIQDEKSAFNPNRPVPRAVSYLQQNYRNKLNLAEIAKYAGVSQSHLASLFKMEVGTSIGDYYRRLRIERARILLLENKMNINEISYHLGFCDVAHFSKTFYRYTKINPSALRREK